MTPTTLAINLSKTQDNGTDGAGNKWKDLFLELAHEAESSNDKLNDNYKNISTDWVNYDCFTVVFAPDYPITYSQKYYAVAFSGLQTDHFGKKTGRALTRTYYAKSIRKESLAPRKLPNMASRYMLPKQYEYAKKHNFDHVFVSFESTLFRKNFTTLFTNMLNKTYKDQNWKELDGLYYTGKMDGMIHEDCWQHVVLNSFSDTPFPLYRKNYE